jgi:hypothetical protein
VTASVERLPIQPSALSPQPSREARRVLALFLLFLGFYLLTASGHFYSTDEETFYIVTQSLGESGTFAVPEGLWGTVTHTNPDGHEYAVTGPVQSILALPLFFIGDKLRSLFPHDADGYVARFCVAMFGAFVTAATVALLYRFARELGYGGGASLGLAAIYGLATTAWPHGRTFFAEPLMGLCLLLVFYGIWRGTGAEGGRRKAELRPEVAEDSGQPQVKFRVPRSAFRVQSSGWLIVSGVAVVAAVGTKPQAAIALPPLGLYFLWRAAAPGWGAGRFTLDWRGLVSASVAWGMGMALAMLPFGYYNYRLYGSPFRTGYSGLPTSIFSTPILEGLGGLLFSSGKGLIWYSPPAILAALAWWPFFRRHCAEALACLGVLLAHLALFSRFYAWHGDGSWGPRYLTSALPFVLLPLPALLAGLRARRLALAGVSVVVALGLLVQLLGVLVNFDWYILASDEQARHFSPPDSPIVGHARILGSRLREWQGRAFPAPDTATLAGGFSYSEGDRQAGQIFPRWTTGAGLVMLHPADREPLLVKVTYLDQRPAAQRAEGVTVLVNGVALDSAAVERRDFSGTAEGWVYQFTVPADAFVHGDAQLLLRSSTWNPAQLRQGDRDEDLGVFVNNLEVWRAGQPLAVREKLTFDPMPRTTRWRFWWFNNDRDPAGLRPHLVDHWAWYAAVAGFDRRLTIGWIAGVTIVALAPLVAGVWLFWRTLPAGALRGLRRRRVRRRPRASARAVRPAGTGTRG